MPLQGNLHDLMLHLQEQGVVNLDTPLKALVDPDVIKAASVSGLPTDIIIGPRYVFVTRYRSRSDPAELSELSASIRAAAGLE